MITLMESDMDVLKTLRPGENGTKRLAARYGDRLVCVRYRQDKEKNRRYTTVEIIIDEGPIEQNKIYRLAPEERTLNVTIEIAPGDTETRARVIDAGGVHLKGRLWTLALGKVVKLGLIERMRR